MGHSVNQTKWNPFMYPWIARKFSFILIILTFHPLWYFMGTLTNSQLHEYNLSTFLQNGSDVVRCHFTGQEIWEKTWNLILKNSGLKYDWNVILLFCWYYLNINCNFWSSSNDCTRNWTNKCIFRYTLNVLSKCTEDENSIKTKMEPFSMFKILPLLESWGGRGRLSFLDDWKK